MCYIAYTQIYIYTKREGTEGARGRSNSILNLFSLGVCAVLLLTLAHPPVHSVVIIVVAVVVVFVFPYRNRDQYRIKNASIYPVAQDDLITVHRSIHAIALYICIPAYQDIHIVSLMHIVAS